MRGAYLYGSAVAGGLRPKSDVDLLVASDTPLRGADRARLFEELLVISAPVGSADGRPLEVTIVVVGDVVPWRHPAMRELQFGEWLRDDIRAGRIPPPVSDPDLAILLTKVRQHSVLLFGAPAAEVFDPIPAADVTRAMLALFPDVVRGVRGEERNALLTTARMWVTLTTGEILPKDVAAGRMLAVLPAEHREVLARARDIYLRDDADDWSGREREVDAFMQHAARLIGAMEGS
jgi:streptomycin 3"-adenylyltransferase